jgi:hypothetical protein
MQPGEQKCPKCEAAYPVPVGKREDRAFKDNLLRGSSVSAPVVLASDHVAPVLPAGIAQFYLPVNGTVPPEGQLVYQPRLLGMATVVFAFKRKGLEHRRDYRYLTGAPLPGQPAAWHAAEPLGDGLAVAPQPEAHWTDVPESLNGAKKIGGLQKGFADFLYGNVKLALLTNDDLKITGDPGEDVVAFQQRCRTAAQQRLVEELASVKAKFRPRFTELNLPFPDEAAEKQGSSLLNLPLKMFSWAIASSPPTDKRALKEQQKRDKLTTDYLAQRDKLVEKWRKVSGEYADLVLKPRKADVQVTSFGLAWAPFWQATVNGATRLVAAYQQVPSTKRVDY